MLDFSYENVMGYVNSKKFTWRCALCMVNQGKWCEKALEGYKTKIFDCKDYVNEFIKEEV